MSSPPRPPRAVVPSLPQALEAVILRALAKLPEERFASMAALEQALVGIAGTMEGAPAAVAGRARGPSGVTTTFSGTAASAPAPRRGKAPALLVGAATLATAAVTLLLWRRPAERAPAEGPPTSAETARPVRPKTAAEAPAAQEARGPASAGVATPPARSPAPSEAPAAQATSAALVPLVIESDPAGAAVIDSNGALLGRTPLRISRVARPGTERLRVEAPGHRTEVVEAALDRAASVSLKLEPSPHRARRAASPAAKPPAAGPGLPATEPAGKPKEPVEL